MAQRRSKSRRRSRRPKSSSEKPTRAHQKIQAELAERKPAEQALRESKGRFRTLAEAAPIGIFLTKPTGECIYTNPIWSTISGLTSEESLGYGWMRAIHPDELERVKQSWRDAAAQKKDYGTDYRVITPAGDLRWVHALATPQVNASGRVVSYVGSVEDITERKRAEEALRERENQLSLIYDNIPDLVSRVDRDLRYLFVNASYERRFGARLRPPSWAAGYRKSLVSRPSGGRNPI